MLSPLVAAQCLGFLLMVNSQGMDSWPEYRGSTQNGHAPHADVPLVWSASKNVRWKTPIHDKGWSTPVIFGNQIWMTTAREDGRQMYAVCVDRRNGRILLDKKIFDVEHPRPLGNDLNGYASPSPVIEEGRVYVHFGSYGTACLDTQTGQVLWQRRDLPCNHFRGPASSPVLFEDMLIFHMDGSDYHYIVALNKMSGETVWRTERSTDYGDLGEDGKPKADGDYRKAYNTPLVIRVDGQLQLVSPSAKAFYSYHPRTGKEIWQCRHAGHSTAGRTLFDGKLVYMNSGSGGSPTLYAIDPRGRGDITTTRVRWQIDRFVAKHSSPVLVDGLIYRCSNDGIVSCVDTQLAEMIWHKRIGGEFSASILYVPGRIYLFDQAGETRVIAPGRKYRELARNQLDAGFMASPVALGKALYLRSKTHLYRIEEP
jgi:outer membrane protein assembly factor BamB